MERKAAAWFARHLDLAAGDRAIAQDTYAMVAERMPFPPQISCLEEREFVFWKEWRVHLKRGLIKAGRSGSGNQQTV